MSNSVHFVLSGQRYKIHKLILKQYGPTWSQLVVVHKRWYFVHSFLSFCWIGRVLLNHRLGQVWILGTRLLVISPVLTSSATKLLDSHSFPLLLIIFFVQSDPSFFLPGLDIFLCHFPINFFLCFLLSCGPFYGQCILLPLTPPAANNNNNNNNNKTLLSRGKFGYSKNLTFIHLQYIHFTIHI